MKKIRLSLLAIVPFLLFMVACEKGSTTLTAVPEVLIDCQISECNGGVSVGTALVLLSKSGCENDFEVPAASTASLSCSASGCSGSATNWVDGDGNPVTNVFTGGYDLCVHIDTDSSGSTSYSTGDIVYERSVTLSSDLGSLSADGSEWEVVN